MYVVIVEDDPLQVGDTVAALHRAFQDLRCDSIETESEFYSRLQQLKENPPDLVILDVMLRWANPSREMPPRHERAKREGFYTAGFRCRDLLALNEETRNIPVIIFTILEAEDFYRDSLSPNTFVLRKGDTDTLVREVRKLVRRG